MANTDTNANANENGGGDTEQAEEPTLAEQIQKLMQTVEAQQATINQLIKGKGELEGQVAKFTSAEQDQNAGGEHNESNGGAPATQQFATIANFNKATKLENAKSKY